jgi:hypothetical protein
MPDRYPGKRPGFRRLFLRGRLLDINTDQERLTDGSIQAQGVAIASVAAGGAGVSTEIPIVEAGYASRLVLSDGLSEGRITAFTIAGDNLVQGACPGSAFLRDAVDAPMIGRWLTASDKCYITIANPTGAAILGTAAILFAT